MKGHHIDVAVYLLTAVGGSLLAVTKSGFSLWALAVVPLVAVVIWVVVRNEKMLKRDLGPLARTEAGSDQG